MIMYTGHSCSHCGQSLVNKKTVLNDRWMTALCQCGISNALFQNDFNKLYEQIELLKQHCSTADMLPSGKRYECQQCEYATESFRAIDNVPAKAHLCKYCYGMVPEDIQKHYKFVDTPELKPSVSSFRNAWTLVYGRTRIVGQP